MGYITHKNQNIHFKFKEDGNGEQDNGNDGLNVTGEGAEELDEDLLDDEDEEDEERSWKRRNNEED